MKTNDTYTSSVFLNLLAHVDEALYLNLTVYFFVVLPFLYLKTLLYEICTRI